MTVGQSRLRKEAIAWVKTLLFAFLLLTPLRLLLRFTDLEMSGLTFLWILLALTIVLRLVTLVSETTEQQ